MTTKIRLAVLAMIAGLNLVSCSTISSAQASTNALNQTSWSLTSLNNQSVIQDSRVTLSFENNKIAGTDGCNRYFSAYTLNADKISINKNIAGTRMACPEPIMQQASTYISALTEATGYKIDGQQLLLIDASGKTLASFTKQSSK